MKELQFISFVTVDASGSIVPDKDGKIVSKIFFQNDGIFTDLADGKFKISLSKLGKENFYLLEIGITDKNTIYNYAIVQIDGKIAKVYLNKPSAISNPTDRYDLFHKAGEWVNQLDQPTMYLRFAKTEAELNALTEELKQAFRTAQSSDGLANKNTSPQAVVDKYGLPIPDLTKNTDTQEVTLCDQLTADPNDPNRMSTGVASDDIIPLRALKACQDSVSQYPNTPRFHFQLGRALRASNREGSIRSFDTASKMGYAGADYEIGRMFALSDDDKYINNAKSYLHRAQDGGVKAATELLGDLEFSNDGFNQGRILDEIYNGKSSYNPKRTMLYLNSFIGPYYDSRDPSCNKLVDGPTKVAAALVGGIGGLGEVFGNPLGTATVTHDGESDAIIFNKKHGCSGFVVRRMFKQIRNFIISETNKIK